MITLTNEIKNLKNTKENIDNYISLLEKKGNIIMSLDKFNESKSYIEKVEIVVSIDDSNEDTYLNYTLREKVIDVCVEYYKQEIEKINKELEEYKPFNL